MSLRIGLIFGLAVAGCSLSSEPGDRYERIDRDEDAGLPVELEPTPNCRRAADADSLDEAEQLSARFVACQGLVDPRVDCLARDRWHFHDDWEGGDEGLIVGHVTYDCAVEAADVVGTLSYQGAPLVIPDRFTPSGSGRFDELQVCEMPLRFAVGTPVDEVVAAYYAWIECAGADPVEFEVFCAGPFRNEYARANWCAEFMCRVRDETGTFGVTPRLGQRPCD